MLENLNNQHPSNKRFDEGKYIDTGEINPLTGERIFYSPTNKQVKTEEQKIKPRKIEKQKTVCDHCKKDPCSENCPCW
mgnify:CR=1 FL=1|jgi:Fe-S-cluster-containing dehydrogenase component